VLILTSAAYGDYPDLVFVQIPESVVKSPAPGNKAVSFLGRYVDGTRIMYLPDSGDNAINLTPEFTGACDPDISFDGNTILFAGKKNPTDSWQIWRMNADGSEKIQITTGEADHFAPLYVGNRFYLNDPQPTPQIIFVSNRHGWINPETNEPVYSLYAMDYQGETIRRISYNLYSDFDPDVLPNGRIVFSSWQNANNRYPSSGLTALLAINNDGTDLMPYYGNHEEPVFKAMARVADFGDRVYFIESDESSWLAGGDIASISRQRPLHSYRKLTESSDGTFHSPAPLQNGQLLAAYREDNQSVYGLYQIDPESGILNERVFSEPGWNSIDAQILASHPEVKGRSNWLIPGSTTGVFFSLNTYRTNLPMDVPIEQGQIKHVRMIEGLPNTQETESNSREATVTTHYMSRRVERDGSFQVTVPSDIPITFQLLDENYVALRTQNAWTWVMGNENRGCIGCHEDRELAPPNRMVDAVTKMPVDLVLPPERRRTVDFQNQIAPMIQENCATSGCHMPNGDAFDLTMNSETAEQEIYNRLLTTSSMENQSASVIPGSAQTSPLVWHLIGEQLTQAPEASAIQIPQLPSDNQLQDYELIQFIEWVDLGAPWNIEPYITTGQQQQ